MVVNPKKYQKGVDWCVDSALELIYDATVSVGNQLERQGLFSFFKSKLGLWEVNDQQISKTIYQLKRQKYIEFDNSDSVVFTNKAKIKVIEKIVSDNSKGERNRLVSFDIPESRRTRRDKFRRAIKRMGFRQIQKSLWVSNIDVGDLVEAAATEYEVNQYVAYFVAEKSNIDNYIIGLLDGSHDEVE